MAAKMQVLMMRMSQEFPEFDPENNNKPYNHEIHKNSEEAQAQSDADLHSNIQVHPALERRKNQKHSSKSSSSSALNTQKQKSLPSRKISRKKKFKQRRLARRAQYSKT